jgi:hypothetical protein
VNFFGDGDHPKGFFLGWNGKEKFSCFLRQESGIFLIFQGIILLVVQDEVFGKSECFFFLL